MNHKVSEEDFDVIAVDKIKMVMEDSANDRKNGIITVLNLIKELAEKHMQNYPNSQLSEHIESIDETLHTLPEMNGGLALQYYSDDWLISVRSYVISIIRLEMAR